LSFFIFYILTFLLFSSPSSALLFTLSLHDALPIFEQVPRDLLHGLSALETVGAGEDLVEQVQHRRQVGPRRRGIHGVEHRLQRRSEEHTSELQSRENLVCRLLLEKKNKTFFLLLIF